jgi:UDP-N-acetylglucosamine 4,6-dehydratase/5-epimerase
MTRFMMTLEEAVELVLYAFLNGRSGDIFVQKAPAATIGTLAESVKELLNSKVRTRVIGTRHGEKLWEVLVSREEMAKAEDLGDYFRIPSDNRDLNYDKFFVEGEQKIARIDDYSSHNTRRLDKEEMKQLLGKLEIFRNKS